MLDYVKNEYYETTTDFIESFETADTTRNLNIMHLNARSCANFETFDEIKKLIQDCKCEIDIIVIGETWLKESETTIYGIDGYNAFHSCRAGRSGGGLSVYVAKSCAVSDVLIEAREYNKILIELKNLKGLDKLFVYAIYRPPGTANIGNFFNDIEHDMQRIGGGKGVMVGDMNINVANLNAAPLHVRNYVDMVASIGMQICNDEITREASRTIIDHVCSNMVGNYVHEVATFCSNISDHNIIMLKVKTRNDGQRDITTTRKIDYERLRELLHQKLATQMPSTGDVNVQYCALSSIVQKSTTEATNYRQLRPKKNKLCEWLGMSPNITTLIRQKNNLWRKHRNAIRQNTCGPDILRRLKELGELLIKAKRLAKVKYYERVFGRCTSTSDTWKEVGKIINLKKNNKCSENITIEKEDIVIVDGAVAEEFAQHFSTVGKKLAEKIKSETDDHPNKMGTLRANAASIFLRPVTEFETSCLINALKERKSAGIDQIAARTIRQCNEQVTQRLQK